MFKCYLNYNRINSSEGIEVSKIRIGIGIF